MIDNSDNMIKARRMVCEELHGKISHFLTTMNSNQEELLEAIVFCGAANREGGTSENEIVQLHSWINESVTRLAIFANYLTGRVDIRVEDDGSATVSVSDCISVKEYRSKKAVTAALNKKDGWCGGHVS